MVTVEDKLGCPLHESGPKSRTSYLCTVRIASTYHSARMDWSKSMMVEALHLVTDVKWAMSSLCFPQECASGILIKHPTHLSSSLYPQVSLSMDSVVVKVKILIWPVFTCLWSDAFYTPNLWKLHKTGELLAAILSSQTWVFSLTPTSSRPFAALCQKLYYLYLPSWNKSQICSLVPFPLFMISRKFSSHIDPENSPYPWSATHPKIPTRLIFLKDSVGS